MGLLNADGTEMSAGPNGWTKLLTQVGLPTALLLIVGYFFMWPAWDKQVEATPRIEQKLDRHIAATEAAETAHREHMRRVEVLLWLNCLNGAKTESTRQACSSVR